MKNLNKYKVQELTMVESKSTNGGIWRAVLEGAVALAYWHWDNWDDIKAGFQEAQQ